MENMRKLCFVWLLAFSAGCQHYSATEMDRLQAAVEKDDVEEIRRNVQQSFVGGGLSSESLTAKSEDLLKLAATPLQQGKCRNVEILNLLLKAEAPISGISIQNAAEGHCLPHLEAILNYTKATDVMTVFYASMNWTNLIKKSEITAKDKLTGLTFTKYFESHCKQSAPNCDSKWKFDKEYAIALTAREVEAASIAREQSYNAQKQKDLSQAKSEEDAKEARVVQEQNALAAKALKLAKQTNASHVIIAIARCKEQINGAYICDYGHICSVEVFEKLVKETSASHTFVSNAADECPAGTVTTKDFVMIPKGAHDLSRHPLEAWIPVKRGANTQLSNRLGAKWAVATYFETSKERIGE